jgi:putative peptidoglycan lipid II flippase
MITARIFLASALLAGVSWLVWRLLDELLGTSLIAQVLSVGTAGAAGLFVYVRAVLVMRVPEAHQVHRLVVNQLARRPQGA